MKFNKNTEWSWETDVQDDGAVYYIEEDHGKFSAYKNLVAIGRAHETLKAAKLACNADAAQVKVKENKRCPEHNNT